MIPSFDATDMKNLLVGVERNTTSATETFVDQVLIPLITYYWRYL